MSETVICSGSFENEDEKGTHDEAVDEELDEEEVSQVGLIRIRKGAEDTSRSAVEDKGFALREQRLLERRDFFPVHSH